MDDGLVAAACSQHSKKNEEKKAILETYTKEYSAEYQAQALIDIAKKLQNYASTKGIKRKKT